MGVNRTAVGNLLRFTRAVGQESTRSSPQSPALRAVHWICVLYKNVINLYSATGDNDPRPSTGFSDHTVSILSRHSQYLEACKIGQDLLGQGFQIVPAQVPEGVYQHTP